MGDKLTIYNRDGTTTEVEPLKPWTPGEVCPDCNGVGKVEGTDEECPTCHGFGHDGRYENLEKQPERPVARVKDARKRHKRKMP